MSVLSYESEYHFVSARRGATFEQVWRWITGQPNSLLSFDELQALLGLRQSVKRGLVEIDLPAVVGSVARPRDFTRSFGPRRSVNSNRWRAIDDLLDRQGFEPIDVYQVGAVYFVLDGHHRVSVARARGLQTIEANVLEWRVFIDVSPDDSIGRIRARLCGALLRGCARC